MDAGGIYKQSVGMYSGNQAGTQSVFPDLAVERSQECIHTLVWSLSYLSESPSFPCHVVTYFLNLTIHIGKAVPSFHGLRTLSVFV